MLTELLFIKLLEAASLASSADNMQPWEFKKVNDTIEVYLASNRLLPTDVNNMFSYMGIGAAIENIVVCSMSEGLLAKVKYETFEKLDKCVAKISFTFCEKPDKSLAAYLLKRATNRSDFNTSPLANKTMQVLNASVKHLNAHIHWNNFISDLSRMATIDASLSYIRLEHKPCHDELFEILRFSKKEKNKYGYGLGFESLEVPFFAQWFARLLRFWSINKLVSKMGIGKMVAKQLASRIRKAGAICLITVDQSSMQSFIEAGRSMQHLWLKATELGLSVQPYGVFPQYLNKLKCELDFFPDKYCNIIKNQGKIFDSIFSNVKNQVPTIVLRIGKTSKQSQRSSFRLPTIKLFRGL